MSRVITVSDTDELNEKVDEYVERGYKVTSSGQDQAVVKEKTVGSWVIHILLLIFTIGFGNIVYLIYSWSAADTVELVVE